jgi:hypothetical protein
MRSIIGQNLVTPVDYERQMTFINIAKVARPFEPLPNTTTPVTLRPNGWPASDCKWIMFTEGTTNQNGEYTLRFKGTAKVGTTGGSPADLLPPSFDPATGYTTQKIRVRAKAGSTAQLHLTFTGGGGFEDASLIRPGYTLEQANTQVFTNELVNLIGYANAGTLRSMGWLEMNGSIVKEFSDFTQESDIFWKKKDVGAPFTLFVKLCNLAETDCWINVPHAASDDCVRKMAAYLRDNLNPKRGIALELSNEHWNTDGRFGQSWHFIGLGDKALAAGDTRFNPTNKYYRGRQAYAKRFCEVNRIFKEVFGYQSYRVRPILGGQSANPDVLDTSIKWVNAYEGGVSKNFWGMSVTGYWGSDKYFFKRPDLTLESFFQQGYKNMVEVGKDSQGNYILEEQSFPGVYMDDRSKSWTFKNQQRFLAQCKEQGVKACVYEGAFSVGEDGGADAVKIGLQNDPRMEKYVDYNLNDFMKQAGDNAGLYMNFVLANRWTAKGVYGATDDAMRLDAPKLKGIVSASAKYPLAEADPVTGLENKIKELEGQLKEKDTVLVQTTTQRDTALAQVSSLTTQVQKTSEEVVSLKQKTVELHTQVSTMSEAAAEAVATLTMALPTNPPPPPVSPVSSSSASPSLSSSSRGPSARSAPCCD